MKKKPRREKNVNGGARNDRRNSEKNKIVRGPTAQSNDSVHIGATHTGGKRR